MDSAAVITADARIETDSIGAFSELPDGTRVLALRVRHSGANAVRLHIGGMRLPAGVRLFVYGLSNGAAVDVAGPWETSGPVAHASFWTPAVRGSDAIVELQADGELPSDLPFEILGSEAADVPDMPEQAVGSVEIRTSLYRGAALTHEVTDGLGIFESDIILGPENELAPATRKTSGHSAVAIAATKFRWPGGIVPYVIDPLIPNPARVQSAITHWNTKMAGVVQLVPRTTEKNYAKFRRAASSSQCASYVGMSGYEQPIYVGDLCSAGNMIHEIGHTFGLWHEQSREDRDRFVTILWANVRSGYEYNFSQNINDGDDINGYDYGSIMHYAVNSFSKNGLPTIQTIPAGVPIGQRSSLSAGDIAAIAKLYPPAAPAPAPAPQTIPVTVQTSPAALQMRVDGVLYTAAKTFDWVAGSAHTIEAVDTTPAAGTKYTFARWSDSGARSHTVVTAATTAAYTATFSLSYIAQTTVAPSASAGAASVTTRSADDYYTANTTVGLTATAASGYCFTGWSELLQGTPANTTVTVNKPYWLQAKFVTGSISVSPASASVAAAGATIQLSVAATTGCLWEARADASWIAITAGRSGAGPLAVTYTVAPNTTGVQRTGHVIVDGKVHTVTQAAPIAVVSLVLIDADTDQPIYQLTEGMTLKLSSLPTRNLNVQAIANPPTVGSVRMQVVGGTTRVEGAAPYALGGDTNGNYWAWKMPVGTVAIIATPYTGASASGTAGTAATVRLQVVE